MNCPRRDARRRPSSTCSRTGSALRSTSPERIQITAECENQEEHSTLLDWCQWIVDEVRHGAAAMAHSPRHGGWAPPEASLDGAAATIVIRPRSTATYLPLKWAFELDQEVIYERLIHDLYQQRLSFIRELVQNSLDAARCQMYLDIAAAGQAPPEYPTEASEGQRRQYKILVSLTTETIWFCQNSEPGQGSIV